MSLCAATIYITGNGCEYPPDTRSNARTDRAQPANNAWNETIVEEEDSLRVFFFYIFTCNLRCEREGVGDTWSESQTPTSRAANAPAGDRQARPDRKSPTWD
eukprot:2810161-Prymnesium_polylepis.1